MDISTISKDEVFWFSMAVMVGLAVLLIVVRGAIVWMIRRSELLEEAGFFGMVKTGFVAYGDALYHFPISLMVLSMAAFWGADAFMGFMLAGAAMAAQTGISFSHYREAKGDVEKQRKAVLKTGESFGKLMGIALLSAARGPVSFALAGNDGPMSTVLFKVVVAVVVVYLFAGPLWSMLVPRK